MSSNLKAGTLSSIRRLSRSLITNTNSKMSITIIVNTKLMISIVITVESNVVDANSMGVAKMKSGTTTVINVLIMDTKANTSIGNNLNIMVALANVVVTTTEM